MIRTLCQSSAGFLALSLLLAATFAPHGPKELASTATVAELEAAIKRQAAALKDVLADPKKFDDNLTKDKVSQSAAMIACLAQALQDHPKAAESKLPAADLREAGQSVIEAETHADAAAGLAAVETALGGAAPKSKEREAWDEVAPMEPVMEAFNGLNNSLRRTVRRSRNPEEDSLDATTGAILSLVMKADTSYVSDDDVAIWQKFSDEQAAAYRAIAAAMKKGDTDTARAQHKAVTKVCTACHDKFRD